MRANDIGSIYPIGSVAPMPGDTVLRAGFRAEQNVRFFSLCREALSVIARRHAANGRKRVLLPAYTCHTVVDPFVEGGWSCAYYGIGLDLRIDIDSFVSTCHAFAPDIVLVHPYYGMGLSGGELDAVAALKQPGRVFIEDLTQCLFATEAYDAFDYYTGSMRKWMAMPDGAFAASNAHDIDGGEAAEEENATYVNLELAAMRLRAEYYDSGDAGIKAVSRQVDKTAQSFLAGSTMPHAMSSYSRSVAGRADFNAIVRQRMANYRYLFGHLHSAALAPICDDLSRVSTAPLYFPVLAKDRDCVSRALIAENIYAPVLWPIPSSDVLVSEDVRKIYDHILALPVDQRYSESDMDRMCSVANSI